MDPDRKNGRGSTGLGLRIGARQRALISLAAASALVLVTVSVALASTLNDVVPRSGTVAGKTYRDWLTRTWRLYFTSPAPGPKPCQTIHIGGRSATVVENFKSGNSSCHVPAGQPIYINEYTTHCSTMPGDHNGFGTSDTDLETCSRGVNGSTTKVLISVWLDKRNVPRFGNVFWRGTKGFSVRLANHRFPGVTQREVRAAAWGWTLLLRKLPKGTHTVLCRVLYPDRRLKTQSLITVHVR